MTDSSAAFEGVGATKTDPRHHRLYTAIWQDPVFVAQTKPVRDVWLHVLLCPERETEGLYEFRVDKAAQRLEYPAADIVNALKHLDSLERVLFDPATNHVLIPQAMKYQQSRNPNGAKAAARKAQQLGNKRLFSVLQRLAAHYGDQRFADALAQAAAEAEKRHDDSWRSAAMLTDQEPLEPCGSGTSGQQVVNERSTGGDLLASWQADELTNSSLQDFGKNKLVVGDRGFSEDQEPFGGAA